MTKEWFEIEQDLKDYVFERLEDELCNCEDEKLEEAFRSAMNCLFPNDEE